MSEKLKQDSVPLRPVSLKNKELDKAENHGKAPEENDENPGKPNEYVHGRGAQINTKNRFLKDEITKEHVEAIDLWTESNEATQYIEQRAKSIVNKVESPDVAMMYS